MPYEIAYSGSDKVVLQRRSFKSAMIFIIFIGSIFSIAGLALIFLMSNVEPPFSYIRFLFAGMGILVVLLGINYPKMSKGRIPETITFDNRKGLIEIEQNTEVSQKGFIAYKDIDRFDVYEEYHSGSHSGKTQSRSYYTYHVLLRKKDGGEWFLREWRSRPDAEKMIAELSKVIDVNAPSVSIPKAPLPDKLNREFQGSKTMLSWRNKLGFAPFIFGGVVLFIGTVFYIIGGAVFSQMADMIIPVSFVLGFIGLIFIGIVFVQVRKMIKNATTTFRISIDKTTFEYAELDNSGQVRLSKITPLKDVYSIVFSHKSSEKNAPLYIFTKEQAEKYLRVKSNPMESIRDLFGMAAENTQLNIEGLNAVECLQLENWLQELIKIQAEKEVI